ncbi:hypothetical protein D3C77_337400 [compost metagenome]
MPPALAVGRYGVIEAVLVDEELRIRRGCGGFFQRFLNIVGPERLQEKASSKAVVSKAGIQRLIDHLPVFDVGPVALDRGPDVAGDDPPIRFLVQGVLNAARHASMPEQGVAVERLAHSANELGVFIHPLVVDLGDQMIPVQLHLRHDEGAFSLQKRPHGRAVLDF